MCRSDCRDDAPASSSAAAKIDQSPQQKAAAASVSGRKHKRELTKQRVANMQAGLVAKHIKYGVAMPPRQRNKELLVEALESHHTSLASSRCTGKPIDRSTSDAVLLAMRLMLPRCKSVQEAMDEVASASRVDVKTVRRIVQHWQDHEELYETDTSRMGRARLDGKVWSES